jgi:hypothetical protein
MADALAESFSSPYFHNEITVSIMLENTNCNFLAEECKTFNTVYTSGQNPAILNLPS